MRLGVPKESFPKENRVAVIPERIGELTKLGFEVMVERGAGEGAGFKDSEYKEKGAKVGLKREEVFESEVIVQVMGASANPKGEEDYKLLREGQILISFLDPLNSKEGIKKLSKSKITSFAMELIPRITRAQSMDALSSMANLAGYKGVLLGAESLVRVLPMMTTAAGTMQAAKVFIVGVGVAGLQAIATARRLGGVVSAYDVRPAVKEQVESLNAKFVEMELDTKEAEGTGGYAKALGEEFYKKQQELMKKVVCESDLVLTTAAVPGGRAPILVTEDMVKGMKVGSVIVDLASERGGNCELTEPGKSVTKHGVKILGPLNIASTIPYHSSQMYSKNISSFLRGLVTKEKALKIDKEDEIIRESLVTEGGEIVNERVKESLKL